MLSYTLILSIFYMSCFSKFYFEEMENLRKEGTYHIITNISLGKRAIKNAFVLILLLFIGLFSKSAATTFLHFFCAFLFQFRFCGPRSCRWYIEKNVASILLIPAHVWPGDGNCRSTLLVELMSYMPYSARMSVLYLKIYK